MSAEPANDDHPSELMRAILARMTPTEQAKALAEARAKRVTVDMLIWRAVQEPIE